MKTIKTVQLWHLRPDAPYKSRLWGLWVVPAEQVQAIIDRIRAVKGWEDTQRVDGPASDRVTCQCEQPCYPDTDFCEIADVLSVTDFAPGLVFEGDRYGDFPDLFAG